MTLPPFRYVAVGSAAEAVALLADHGEAARLLAGGQSLVPMLNLRLVRPDIVVDLNPIGAGPVEEADGTVRIPALTRYRTLADDPTVRRSAPMLGELVGFVGNVRVRNRGTAGGSLAHADPAAELPCAAVALGASVRANGADGERLIPAGELFDGYLTTTLRPTEVITELLVPAQRPGTGSAFVELTPRAADFALVAVAATVRLEPDAETCAGATLAVAAVSDRPFDGGTAVAHLIGQPATEPAIRAAGDGLADLLDPAGDVHASAGYRKRLASTVSVEALRTAAERARRSLER